MSLKHAYENKFRSHISELNLQIAELTDDSGNNPVSERLSAGKIEALSQQVSELRVQLSSISALSEGEWNRHLSSQQMDFE